MIALSRIRELDLAAPSAPGRPLFLSAASGLVCIHSFAYVIADDELHVGAFPTDGAGPGHLLRLFDGTLPDAPKARKKKKPDIEAIALLPEDGNSPHGGLLVLGSGSRPNRQRGAVLTLDDDGGIAGPPRIVDLSLLYAALSSTFSEINVEGAVVVGDEMRLFQRGNKEEGRNAVIRFALGAFLAALSGSTRKIDVLGIDHFELGAIESVPLSFTDAAALPDGRVIFCAVAEDTDNAYDDGCCAGAAIGIIDRGKLCYLRKLDRPYKIEGVHARIEGDSIALLLVTDADNPDVPAELLSARLNV